MSDAPFEMFSSTGAIRTDFTDAEIASLAEDRQEKWASLSVANAAMIEAERTLAEAQVGIAAAVTASQLADDVLSAARPKFSQLDLVRQAADAQRGIGIVPDPIVEAAVVEAATAADAASLAVAKAHRARAAATTVVRRARENFAAALMAWSADASKPDQKALMAHVATTQAERAIAEKALTETKPASPLDAFMKAGSSGKRGRALAFPGGRMLRVLPSAR